MDRAQGGLNLQALGAHDKVRVTLGGKRGREEKQGTFSCSAAPGKSELISMGKEIRNVGLS